MLFYKVIKPRYNLQTTVSNEYHGKKLNNNILIYEYELSLQW